MKSKYGSEVKKADGAIADLTPDEAATMIGRNLRIAYDSLHDILIYMATRRDLEGGAFEEAVETAMNSLIGNEFSALFADYLRKL